MVLHMDEATPHLHVDFIPVATEQSRGLSTRVSMKHQRDAVSDFNSEYVANVAIFLFLKLFILQ